MEKFVSLLLLSLCLGFYLAGLTESTTEVIPPSVDGTSLRIHGTWDNFSISWEPVTVSHGVIYYELILKYGSMRDVVESNVGRIVVTNLRPYTNVTLNVQACTSWGCSNSTEKIFRTPMAAPSVVQDPRVFVTHTRQPLNHNYSVHVDFRWSQPLYTNGDITSYTVYVSEQLGFLGNATKVTEQKKYYEIDGAKKNKLYYFQVEACTPVGCSEKTDVIVANTTGEKPVPLLLTTTNSGFGIFYPDEQKSWNLATDEINSFTYLAQDETFYLLDEEGHVFELDKREKKQIFSLNGSGDFLAMDWVGRDLYWIEETKKKKVPTATLR